MNAKIGLVITNHVRSIVLINRKIIQPALSVSGRWLLFWSVSPLLLILFAIIIKTSRVSYS